MQRLCQPLYFSFNMRQGDVWGLTGPMLMCMLMKLKYRTSFFLSVSCLFNSMRNLKHFFLNVTSLSRAAELDFNLIQFSSIKFNSVQFTSDQFGSIQLI